jgi:tRNA A-37 threonylcarbamoyl transferase component Bud32
MNMTTGCAETSGTLLPAPLIDAARLRAAGRHPAVPFRLTLADGKELLVLRLLRVLPGKRIVGEAEFAGRRVLAKVFITAGSERHWLQERAGIEALRRTGMPTPEVLSAAVLAGGGQALITVFHADAESLAAAWAGVNSRPVGDAAAVAVLSPALAMLARMHRVGLTQEDLHLGNFLRIAGGLLIIDGDSVKDFGRPLTATDATANLGMLLAQLPAAWDTARTSLLAIYKAADGIGDLDDSALQTAINRVRDWRLKDFLGKCVRDCTLFAVEQSTARFTAVLRKSAKRLAPLLTDPDRVLEAGIRLKSGNTCTVARVRLEGLELTEAVIKRYNLKNVGHALLRLWRPSRAWHSWREAHRLQLFGIATPTPLALIEERLGPLRRRAWLITDYCPGDNLADHLAADCEPPAAESSAIAALFATLHRLRISHGDLKATNLLWHAGKVWLIDLDACTQHRSEAAYRQAWRRDKARLLRNWPEDSVLGHWFRANLPPA